MNKSIYTGDLEADYFLFSGGSYKIQFNPFRLL